MNKLERLELTRKIELTCDENRVLGSALYFAMAFMDEWLEEYEDDKDCMTYKNACKNREGFVHLLNRLYPHILGGESDEK